MGSSDIKAAVIQIIFVMSAFFDINWLFFGLEEFKITVVRNTAVKILTLVAIFVFVKDSSDVYVYIFIMATGYLLSQLLLWPFIKGKVKYVHTTIQDLRKHIKPDFLLFIPLIATSIYKIMDKIMLGNMASMSELGFYENAEKIIQIPVALITAVGTVMLPRVTSLIAKKNENDISKYMDISMTLVLAFSNAAALGIIAIGREFSVIFYGQEFEKSGLLMELLAITIIFLGAGNVIRTQYLIPRKMDKIYVYSAILGAVINFLVNFSLIPHLNAIGACIGTIIAEFIVCGYQMFMIRKKLNFKQYFIDEIVFLLIGVLMYLAIQILHLSNLVIIAFIIKILFGVLIYSVFTVLYLQVTKRLYLLGKMIRR